MNVFFIIIIIALFFEFFIYNLCRFLDIKNISTSLPGEFINYYDEAKYKKSQKYLISNTKFNYITSSFDLLITLGIIFSGFFNIIDLWVRSFNYSSMISGVLFFGVLFLLQDIISTPLSIYKTFVIEEKFGFNKTSIKTYFLDKLKSYILLIIFGTIIFSIILFFFENYGSNAWIYAWLIISVFMVLIQPIFTLFIAPLFNKFSPIEEGSLKNKITDFAKQVNFPISRIDIMDGSKRSSKSNAYFSGLGKNKRIALFDTLIENHSEDELLSIIAHEIGHYKKKHNIKGIILGVLQVGLLFFLLSLFINNRMLFDVFSMENLSIYASLLFFTMLYSPIELIMSFITNTISRKHEFEADAFAKESIGSSKFLIEALKKLTVTNLGNLKPHPLTVKLNYSHPPVLERIQALK